jgi:hypothetical protein
MSQEHVELVQRLLPPSGIDLAAVVRNDELIAGFLEQAAPHIHPEFECLGDWGGDRAVYQGLDGLRALFLDWMSPWMTYRSEIQGFRDLGDQVLVLVRDHGRRPESELEVEVRAASVWSFRDEKIARAELYARRSDAMAAVGLAE